MSKIAVVLEFRNENLTFSQILKKSLLKVIQQRPTLPPADHKIGSFTRISLKLRKMEEIKKLFEIFDVDQRGVITTKSVRTALRRLDYSKV